MKKLFVLAALVISLLIPVFVCDAADGKVTYSGNSGDFIFEPGTDYSPTDLFADFKDVMPGDVLTQKITVKNNAESRVEIFLQALGAADDDSADFLSQLNLQVIGSSGKVIFDDKADQAMTLIDPVSLGKFAPGEEAQLDVKLIVPGELDNTYADRMGHLEWQFSVSEVANEHKPESGEPEQSSAGEPSKAEEQISVVSQVSFEQPGSASGGAESYPGGHPGGSTGNMAPGGNDQPLNPAKTGEAAVFIVLLVLMAAAMGGVILSARKKNDKED